MNAALSFLITVVDSCASAKLALDALYLPYCPNGPVTSALGHCARWHGINRAALHLLSTARSCFPTLLSLAIPTYQIRGYHRLYSIARGTFPIC